MCEIPGVGGRKVAHLQLWRMEDIGRGRLVTGKELSLGRSHDWARSVTRKVLSLGEVQS